MKKNTCFALLLSFTLGATILLAQEQDVPTIAEREVERRQSRIGDGEAALVQGRAAMQSKQFAQAHDAYRKALDFLPGGAASRGAHDEAMRGFCESGVKLAEQRLAEGKRAEAEQIAEEILTEQYDPNCTAAHNFLQRLQDPAPSRHVTVAQLEGKATTETYSNTTMGPKFLAKVADVKRLLDEAEEYYQSGRYDLAHKRYDQVLALDPYNVAARRGQERLDLEKTRYGEEAYNETRARQLWQVQKGWEEPVRKYGPTVGAMAGAITKDVTGTARITNKLNSIIIPKIEFRDASIREAIDFLRQQAAENDPAPDGRKGVDIVLRLAPVGRPAGAIPAVESAPPLPGASPEAATPAPAPVIQPPAASPGEARITITLNEIPLGEALRYIASQAGLKVKVEPYAVSIIPVSEQSNDLFTKEYRVPPGFISGALNVSASALAQGAYTKAPGAAPIGTAKDTEETTGGRQLVTREGAKEFLEGQGVQFPPGASAHFLAESSRLIVRNTEDNLDLVDALVEQANVAIPKQVEIESKFVEITQTNLKELGFDWLLGNFGVGGNKVRFGGGTSGTGANFDQANFPNPITDPVTGQISQFPVTSGNRSGNLAISGNAIDALLLGTSAGQALAPGIFGLAGLMTNPEFQVVIRALNQKKGVDLLSAPRVTTKSGQRAVIEIVREFRYPTQYTAPQLPTFSGGGSGTTVAPAIVTPTTPTQFETRNTGVTLEVEPVVGPDGITIDLNLVPQVVEFEGFINYGSPIFAAPTAGATSTDTITTTFLSPLRIVTDVIRTIIPGTPATVITPNIINQPIFSSRKVTTSVSVWDGQTVVLGGLMREDVQKTEDRTPIIGDIPIVGRLFRTNVDQHVKRNLVIFVTAHLVNPGGQLINQTEEDEETQQIEPPILPEVPLYKK